MVGTGLQAAAFGAWFAFVSPINARFAAWTPQSVPPDWTRTRNQWEYVHGVRFVLQLVGLGALVASVVVESSARVRVTSRRKRLWAR